MRITTLGTSHGEATHFRYNTSTAVEADGRIYIVDAGEPVTASLRRAGLRQEDIAAVFISHMHADHATGLPRLTERIIDYGGEEQRAAVYLPEAAVVAPLTDWLLALRTHWPSPRVELRLIEPGVFYKDDSLRVEALPTRHLAPLEGGPGSYSFALESGGKRVLFTADLSADLSDFPRTPCDLCLCEMAHFTPDQAVPVLRDAPIGRLVLTHLVEQWEGEDGERALLDAMAGLPYPVSIAHDGDCFDV